MMPAEPLPEKTPPPALAAETEPPALTGQGAPLDPPLAPPHPAPPPPDPPSAPPYAAPPPPDPRAPEYREYRWYHKVWAVLFITFCLDIGLFLLISPWTDAWDNFAAYTHALRPYCDNLYVRGAISGLGVINLYISLGEVFRLRRFSRH
jgi:hypothetical protein